MAEKQILIICGEASGDLNAANLVKSIKTIAPEIKFASVGGEMLRQQGCRMICDIKEFSVIGLFDVLKKLPRFFALKKTILQEIKSTGFAAVIFVDFSGFNLRMAKAINRSIPAIYYISPQVWASRKGRVKTIKKYIDKMLVLFRFEKEFYDNYGIKVEFVGHPLLDIVKPTMEKTAFLSSLGFSADKKIISLLPGSRCSEVERILPIMLKACKLIENELGKIQVVIAKSTQVSWDLYKNISSGSGLNLKTVEGKTYDCMNAASFCLVASGTATLETAIMQEPFAVIYKMNLLNYLLYRPQVKVPFISLVNILSGKMIVPEFIQFNARPKKISAKVVNLLKNPKEMDIIKKNLQRVNESLGEKGASLKAARQIVDLLKNK
ncbi:MAG: lipid-A-disaccharide synthase [Candidatus Omnitrophica bacterium]|nr:lipid-A-disaccharide synthase [Candidatus Omnitrophota bacterium]